LYSPSLIFSSTLVAIIEDTGSIDGTLYKFPSYTDTPPSTGEYYYAVLPTKTAYTEKELAAYINYTVDPISVTVSSSVVASVTTTTVFQSLSSFRRRKPPTAFTQTGFLPIWRKTLSRSFGSSPPTMEPSVPFMSTGVKALSGA
jgi:hypothetical protein